MDDRLAWNREVRVLNSSFIRANVPMSRAIDLMETAFSILSEKSAYVPPRVVMSTPDHNMSIFFKPAFLSRHQRLSIKILSQIHENLNSCLPTIKGTVLLVDMVTGQIISICDGNYVTSLRTGAASGIATRYLAVPDASTAAIFGCGAQGASQLEAIMAVRTIKTVYLFDQQKYRAVHMAKHSMPASSTEFIINPEISILKNADIICTATPSPKPLFYLRDLKPGVHINAIGSYRPDMNEIDPEILGHCRIYLDDAPACIHESGDLINPLKSGIIKETDIQGEIGELISGSIPGRQKTSEITVFKSVGNAIQDFFIANEAYEKSFDSDGTQIINLTD